MKFLFVYKNTGKTDKIRAKYKKIVIKCFARLTLFAIFVPIINLKQKGL